MFSLAGLRRSFLSIVRAATLPTASTGLPRPAVVAVDGASSLQFIGADGTLQRPATGSDTLALGSTTDPWIKNLATADAGGSVLSVSGILRDGNGNAVPNGVVKIHVNGAISAVADTSGGSGSDILAVQGYTGAAVNGYTVVMKANSTGSFAVTFATGTRTAKIAVFYRHLSLFTTQAVA